MTAFTRRTLCAMVAMVPLLLAAPMGARAQADPEAQQVKQSFESFFDPSTPRDQRVALLQNGDRFEQQLSQQERSRAAQQTSAVVSDAEVHGDRAVVTYTIELKGRPVLRHQRGEMVKEDGHWKVSARTFCQVESLSGMPPAACRNP